LPESVVWLYANNRVAEAEKIISDAARLNNITMPDKILAQPAGTTDTADSDRKKTDDDACKTDCCKLLDKFRNRKYLRISEEAKDGSERYTVLDIFRSRRMTINMFCVVFLWSVKYISDTAQTLSSIIHL